MSQEVGVVQRINSPIVSTFVDTDCVTFQRYIHPCNLSVCLSVCLSTCILSLRQKSGIWGFRSDKVENINGYDAKVS